VQFFQGQAGMEGAHAAGDIEPDAAGGNDATFGRVESGHAADGKAVTPVSVRHGIRRLDDARQLGDVGYLLVDFFVHVAN
jgi:hypothetical protein